jgi:hypothetical protein
MATLLFQDSVTYRGDYWRAGWNMTISKPFFGFGMDSYGDWYRLYRTKEATLRRGPDAVSNSAHNVLLDLSSSGGFFLLFGYLLILFFTLRSAINILKQKPKFDAIGSSLVLAWFAYLIQSLISINQLGLAFWGWVLSGAIVGYDLRMRNPQLGVENKSKSPVPAGTILMGISGLAIGITISIWPLVKDISFRSALETRNATIMDKSASRFPQTSYYYVYLSELYLTNKLNDRSLEMANKALEINSRDFNALKILLANSTISEYEERSIRDRMLEIDPFNYTIKASK